MIKCVNCGFLADEKFNFCPSCGSALIKKESNNQQSQKNNQLKIEIVVCEVCGENTNNKNGFCENCGAKLTGREEPAEINEVNRVKVSTAASKVKEEKIEEKPKGKITRTNNKEWQKKQPVISTEKKSLTNIQILLITGSIIVVVFVILIASGVFDSNQVSDSIKSESGSNPGNKIDLSQLQEINNLEKVIKSDTTNLNNILDLAHRLNDSGFFEKAVGYYQMYLRRNPKNTDVQIDLGVCYFELKRYEKAKEEMLKGIKMDPKHQIGLFNLGVVNLAEGNLDSAKYWWKRTLEINENSEIAKRAKQLLESH